MTNDACIPRLALRGMSLMFSIPFVKRD